MIYRRAVLFFLDEIGVASLFHPLGDAPHGPIERALFPPVGEGRAVENLLDPVRVNGQLKGVRAFRAERAFIDRAVVIALNVNDLAAPDISSDQRIT
jgi:hypothetical protein